MASGARILRHDDGEAHTFISSNIILKLSYLVHVSKLVYPSLLDSSAVSVSAQTLSSPILLKSRIFLLLAKAPGRVTCASLEPPSQLYTQERELLSSTRF